MGSRLSDNKTAGSILIHSLLAAVSLFFNGLGVYLTIHANIGAGPWDVFNLGLSNTFGILYGNASIAVSFAVLLIDILLHEPIGISMIIDAIVVGKSVDFFNYIDILPVPKNLFLSILMMIAGLVIEGYTLFFYMSSGLGCGPRDTLLVGLKKRLMKLPIGAVSIAILCLVTFVGWLLGGKVGIGTLICAFGFGPIMQFAFYTVGFNAESVRHQSIPESGKILFGAIKNRGRGEEK
ncbi:MAG: hypothetical protein Q4F31_05610 [Eubacteriales bacterium]|nr:hypothetical protein [Eubacteriales bacterium]